MPLRRSSAVRVSFAWPLALCVVTALSAPAIGAVQPPAAMTPTTVTPPRFVAPASPVPTTRFIDLKTHGNLRLRSQWLHNGSLGEGGSAQPSTLKRLYLAPNGSDVVLTDVRLRVDPRLYLGARARIDAQLDLTGGLIFGAKLNGSGLGDRFVGMFGNTAKQDAVAVRRAWATFDVFGLAKLIVGRTGDHFGLGLWRNDGRDPRADFQSDVDRVALRGDLFGMRITLSRDTLVTLPVVAPGHHGDDLYYGLQGATDVIRWLAQVEGGVLEPGKKGLRWGAALSYHSQSLGLRLEHSDDVQTDLAGDCVSADTCTQLVPREALMIVPQATVSWSGSTGLGALKAAAEVVVRVASFDNTDALPNTDTSTTLVGGALVGQLSLTRGSQVWGLRAGWASGDDAGGFGVNDRHNLSIVDPVSKELVHRSIVTGMTTHRGFLIDGILFREVIGAVANAWYARPSWRLDVHPRTTTSGLSFELACLVAGAAQWGATPGRRSWLGVEPELKVDARFGRLGRMVMQTSLLLPGAAFDAGLDGAAAEPAWRVSASWIVDF